MLEKKWYTSFGTSMLVHMLIFGLCVLGLSYASRSEPNYIDVTLVELLSPPPQTEPIPQEASAPDIGKPTPAGSAVEPLVVDGPATDGDLTVAAPVNAPKGTGNYIGGSSGNSDGGGTVVGPPKPAGPTRGPEIIAKSKPSYPNIARQNSWEGVVKLKILVSADGGVEDVQIIGSSGYEQLDQAAVANVQRHWRFSPALRNGQPVDTWITLPVRFDLQDD